MGNMRRVVLCLAVGFVFAQALWATDITTRSGVTYSNAQITEIEWDGLRVTHSTGVDRIPAEELPQTLQERYRFDIPGATAYHKHVAEAREAAVAEEERRQGTAGQFARRQNESRVLAAKIAEEGKRAYGVANTFATVGYVLLAFFIIAVSLLLYFLPAIIGRRKTNAFAIFILNLLAGWTFVGWVGALVWACTKDSAMDLLARHRIESPPQRYLRR